MKEQILIVEDEQDTAELLRYNLDKAGYAAVIARNGEEAIDAVQCNSPDLVLLDVMMPQLDGWEVCRVLRESSKGKTMPILMLSALADEEARIKGLSLGADDYISKPFSIKEVLLKVAGYVKRQQELRQFQDREKEHDTSLRYLVHEMRNAMTVLGGYSALAAEKGDHARYLKTIKASAFHAQSLLKDAALLSRLEKNAETLSVEPLDVGLLTREIIEIFEQTARRNNTEILLFNDASALVLTNRTATRQVLINLISNAVKYNRSDGKVWISLKETENRIDVSITDEGKGISQAELPKVFDKYYRAAGSEQITGAGMGLYIVRLLLGAMGGTIKAVSNPGLGSTFTFSLPRVRTATLSGTIPTASAVSSLPETGIKR